MHRIFTFVWFLLVFGITHQLMAQVPTVNSMTQFYDLFVREEENIVSSVYPTPSPVSPTPSPPSGPVTDPAPISGYLPVVISNTTALSDDQIYVTIAGQQTATDATQYFFQPGSNAMTTPIAASATTISTTYSYKLSSFQRCSTGAHNYIVYVPNLKGTRFYFSIGAPMYLQTDANTIQPPSYFAFYDPNYNTLYESIEVTFRPTGGTGGSNIAWTASTNTTEVDAFCFPIRISYYSYSASNPTAVTPLVQSPNALPSGFGEGGLTGATTRSGILTNLVNGFNSGDQTGAVPKVWPRLAVPFYTNPYAATGLQTYLRVLSPKQGMGADPGAGNTYGLTTYHLTAVNGMGATTFHNFNFPGFAYDYLSSTSYGDASAFLNSLFSYFTGGTNLYLSSGGATPTVYQGVTTGSMNNYTLTLTGISGPNSGQVNTLLQTNVLSYKMFSGSQIMTGSGPDNQILGFYFGDAFTVGLLPSTNGTSMSAPINITDANWENTNIANYYVPLYNTMTIPGGPWYDLYAKLLHSVAVRNSVTGGIPNLNGVGLCYGYDFDDSLGISGTITPSNLTPNSLNPYLGITLGAIDTNIPVYSSDMNTYAVTFTFPMGGNTLQYQQGSNGAWISVTSGQTIMGLQSNSSNPLSIRYHNGQGPNTYHQFVIYLYYQLMQPVNSYNSSETSIINSSTITPNSSTPTSFTINLLP